MILINPQSSLLSLPLGFKKQWNGHQFDPGQERNHENKLSITVRLTHFIFLILLGYFIKDTFPTAFHSLIKGLHLFEVNVSKKIRRLIRVDEILTPAIGPMDMIHGQSIIIISL